MTRAESPPASPDDIEQQFYEALQNADIDKLMALWADDEEIACVHPGGPRVVGAGPIRASFEAMFANGPINARAERVRRLGGVSSAIHHVLERVQVMDASGPQSAWVLATNVYVKTALGWRLAVHHASPGSPREIQEISESPSVLH
ncbi:MAG: nuclear transport factor 2 family protein [Burkholderiales bacterium]|jgi:ketosteroid isomerase-like protein|nr:MAG: nuclear transport factor 2 family protein [Burkholderiales bacterium]